MEANKTVAAVYDRRIMFGRRRHHFSMVIERRYIGSAIGHRTYLCYFDTVKSIFRRTLIMALVCGFGTCAPTSNLSAKTAPAGTDFSQNGKVTLHRGQPCTPQIMFDFHPVGSKTVVWIAAGAHE